MVERAALEMRYTRKRIEGSNPPLSAVKENRGFNNLYFFVYHIAYDYLDQIRENATSIIWVKLFCRSSAVVASPVKM